MQDSKRKDDHIALADAQYHQSGNGLQAIRFIHHALPESRVSDSQLDTTVAGLALSTPFYINAMTGGSEQAQLINRKLAEVARETGLAMASGSVSVALKHPEVAPTFSVLRDVNPNGTVFANIGAHHGIDAAKRAVDLLKADALQIHLNVAQELAMPEGDREFVGWLDNIAAIVADCGVPVIVKEVGCGLSRETVAQLQRLGVAAVDLSGRGGTNFVTIEDGRRERQRFSHWAAWGQTTAEALLDAQEMIGRIDVVASGGVQTPMDVLIAGALGARAVGVAGHFLQYALHHSVSETVDMVTEWQHFLNYSLALLGVKRWQDLQQTDILLSPELAHWCEARGIAWHHFSQRSQQKKSNG